MNTIRIRLILLSMLVLTLAACGGGAFRTSETQAIDSQTVTTSMYYIDEQEEGPTYQVTFNVPEDWVGEFEFRNNGNTVVLSRIVKSDNENVADKRADIFTIFALSDTQYWQQIGSYPGGFPNIKYTQDTYFAYRTPIDPHYAGLPDETYEAFASQVPDIMDTFEVVES